MRKINGSDLEIFSVALGGNVFGWTANEAQSFEVLDAYAAGGGNFIDTADMYSAWAPGNSGGESENIIGKWVVSRKLREKTIIATKVGKQPGLEGLSAKTIAAAAEDSLRRLRTDYIDLYYAHADDEKTPLEETLGAFDSLVRAGKVRYVAASNYTASRLAKALAISDQEGFARFIALQQHYNLMERAEYEGEVAAVVQSQGLSSLPYFALAKGFLTGKYRPNRKVESVREEGASAYLNDKGLKVLAALDQVAAEQDAPVASVALAWLAAQPTVAAPIASARTSNQLVEILRAAELHLTELQLRKLSDASA